MLLHLDTMRSIVPHSSLVHLTHILRTVAIVTKPIRQLTVTQSSLLMHASKHFVAVEGVSIVWGEVTSAGPVAPLPDAPIVEASTIPVYVQVANHREVSSNLLRQHHHSILLLVHLHRLRTTFVQAVSRQSYCKQLVQGYTTFPSRSTHLRFVCC